MAIKLNRAYEFRVQREDSTYRVIKNPITIKFTIQRNNLLSSNSATFEIYNLSPSTRKEIRRDDWNLKYDKNVLFMAGYGDNLSICFSGKVQMAASVREGVDFITTVEGFDNPIAIAEAPFSKAYKKGDSYLVLMNDVVGQLSSIGVQRGAISKRFYVPETNSFLTLDQIVFQKDITVQGSCMDVLRNYFGPKVFIDNATVNYLNEDEYARASLVKISSQTGLLGTPRQANKVVYVDILFQPGIRCGQLITLDSIEGAIYEQTLNKMPPKNPNFNGDYRVMGITHKGTISGSVGGEAVTTLALTKFIVKPNEVLVGG